MKSYLLLLIVPMWIMKYLESDPSRVEFHDFSRFFIGVDFDRKARPTEKLTISLALAFPPCELSLKRYDLNVSIMNAISALYLALIELVRYGRTIVFRIYV